MVPPMLPSVEVFLGATARLKPTDELDREPNRREKPLAEFLTNGTGESLRAH